MMREVSVDIEVRRWRIQGRRGRLLARVKAYTVEIKTHWRDDLDPNCSPSVLEIIMPRREWETLERVVKLGPEGGYIKLTITPPPRAHWQRMFVLWRCVLTGMRPLSSRRVSVTGRILADATVKQTKKRGSLGVVTDVKLRTRRARKVEP
jgi:hypothetical protein